MSKDRELSLYEVITPKRTVLFYIFYEGQPTFLHIRKIRHDYGPIKSRLCIFTKKESLPGGYKIVEGFSSYTEGILAEIEEALISLENAPSGRSKEFVGDVKR